MVELDVSGTTVTVRVTGSHRFLALRDHVSFDLSQVKRLGPAPVDLRPPWVRAPGTFFPGVIAAGIFRGKGRKEFWDTRFDGQAVLIDLADSDITRLVVDVEDAQTVLHGLSSVLAA
ncbi:hypothetical protein ACFXHA_37665 [Nocardia sp. NPDC059240]|uniref:hypothetical protein n=1 Tax=Nocardia sp. NPDC059240 TaxID=3346786 RepID=UPI00367AB419